MNSEYSVEELVPHSGKMSLLDRITDYGDIWLQAEVDITVDAMFADEKGVPAWVGLEYLAQAIGAFAGLQERRSGGKPKIGFLLGSRKYQCSSDYFNLGDTLVLKVEEEMQGENGLSVFNGSLINTRDTQAINYIEATARLNVFQPDDAEAFLKGK
jgi:predicted hotdog family 3-hydroxylacyl-ACP dehydratase